MNIVNFIKSAESHYLFLKATQSEGPGKRLRVNLMIPHLQSPLPHYDQGFLSVDRFHQPNRVKEKGPDSGF